MCWASRDYCARLEPLARQKWRAERLALGERVCYLRADGVSKSRVLVEVEKVLGDGITSRNWGHDSEAAGAAAGVGRQVLR